METFGTRLSSFRREKGFTQENIADRLNISAQAVSKWENDVSSPDIDTLLKLSEILDVSLDELLGKSKKETRYIAETERSSIDDMMLRVYVDSSDGDRVRVNLPMALVSALVESGTASSFIGGNKALDGIDFASLLKLVEQGVIGELVTVDSSDGDHVRITVEPI